MEEPEKDTVISAHKRSKVLFYVAIIGTACTFLSTGTFLISTGELKETMRQGRENDATLLSLSKASSFRLTSIETGNEKRTVIDSAYRLEDRKDKEELKGMVKNLQTRMSRVEWKIKLPPLELQNDNSLKSKNMIPFGDTSEKENDPLAKQEERIMYH